MGFGEEVLFFNNVADLPVGALIITFADLRIRALTLIITFDPGILSRRSLRSRSEAIGWIGPQTSISNRPETCSKNIANS